MRRMETLLGTLLVLAASGSAWAVEPGWVIRVCTDQAYTWAREVEVEVTDDQGKNKQDLVDWRRDSPTGDFPVAGALAQAPALRVECDANPYDAQAYVCVLYGEKLVRTIMFQDEFDATVKKTETDTNCPCMPSK